MSTTLLDKLKPEFHTNPPAEENGILLCLDEAQVQGDNAKIHEILQPLSLRLRPRRTVVWASRIRR